MKTTFTSASGRIRHDIELPAADASARSGLRVSFVAVSIVAHLALFVAMRAPHDARAAQPAREQLVMFEMPALAAPPPLPEAPPEVAPPPPVERAPRVRVAAPLEAVASNPPPASEHAAEPTAAPSMAAAAPAGALPTDGQGSLAMATGAGGGSGPIGGGGVGTGNGSARNAGMDGAAGSGTGVDRRALALAWKAAVERLLRQRASLHYPRSARRARLGGTVLLSITVDAQGHITLVRVDQSSGVESLDEAAVATVTEVGAVPAPPSELHWQTRALRMPIAYRVD